MTSPFHATLPAIITYKATGGNIWLTLLAGVLGMLPDLPSNKYYSLFPGQRVYNKLHRPWLWLKGWKLWSVIATYVVFFPVGLHVAMDYRYHTDSDGMRNLYEMVLVEAFCWIVLMKVWGF